MGVMKKSLLFGILVAAMCVLPVTASMTVEESTDAEYMINSGYSESAAEDVFVLKNRATGKPIEPLYNKNQNALVKFYKKFNAYLDPSIENVDRIHHDIKRSPSYTDL